MEAHGGLTSGQMPQGHSADIEVPRCLSCQGRARPVAWWILLLPSWMQNLIVEWQLQSSLPVISKAGYRVYCIGHTVTANEGHVMSAKNTRRRGTSWKSINQSNKHQHPRGPWAISPQRPGGYSHSRQQGWRQPSTPFPWGRVCLCWYFPQTPNLWFLFNLRDLFIPMGRSFPPTAHFPMLPNCSSQTTVQGASFGSIWEPPTNAHCQGPRHPGPGSQARRCWLKPTQTRLARPQVSILFVLIDTDPPVSLPTVSNYDLWPFPNLNDNVGRRGIYMN